jgi:hypothetical protein
VLITTGKLPLASADKSFNDFKILNFDADILITAETQRINQDKETESMSTVVNCFNHSGHGFTNTKYDLTPSKSELIFHHQLQTDDSAITVYQESLTNYQYTSSNRWTDITRS